MLIEDSLYISKVMYGSYKPKPLFSGFFRVYMKITAKSLDFGIKNVVSLQ